jgi:2-methylcitrate dehydratase PrpD
MQGQSRKAMGLSKRKKGLNMRDEILDKAILDLAGKVQLSVSKKWELVYPKKRGATVYITGSHGKK